MKFICQAAVAESDGLPTHDINQSFQRKEYSDSGKPIHGPFYISTTTIKEYRKHTTYNQQHHTDTAAGKTYIPFFEQADIF